MSTPKIFNTAEDAQRFYDDLKFDVASEGYTKINKQISDPVPKCCFCDKTADKDTIMGIKINDNEKRTQVVASICKDHNTMLRNLDKHNPELAEVQNMVRFFFPESADSIIKLFYMNHKWQQCKDPIYLEYFSALKWTVEEIMLMKITDSRPPCETPGYTSCVADGKCVICGEDSSSTTEFFSPIKQCWLNLATCEKCEKDLRLEKQDMEYEIRTMYFGSYEKIDELSKRVAVQQFTEIMKNFQYKILFLDIRLNKERVTNLLHLVGVDAEHSLLQPEPKAPEEKAEEEKAEEEKAEDKKDD